MRFYHRTTKANAQAIIAGGFRDGEGTYMTDTRHRGVWLSDVPLDENEGAGGEVVLSFEMPEELAADYEWIEDGKPYREFLCPTELVNQHRPFTVTDGDGRATASPRPVRS
jgi:hypothetical protein